MNYYTDFRSAAQEVAQDTDRPVYMQDWWLNIAADPAYSQAVSVTVARDGKIVGRLPYTIHTNSIGMCQGLNLAAAHLLQPIIDASPSDRRLITRQLLTQLPRNATYVFTLPADFEDVDLFKEQGFTVSTQVNFRIPPADPEAVKATFPKRTRERLKENRKGLVVEPMEANDFMEFYAASIKAENLNLYWPLEMGRRLLEAAVFRDQGKILTARNKKTQQLDAAVACVWDRKSYYYLFTRRRPWQPGDDIKPHPGAIHELMWSHMQEAHRRGLVFDFDGAPDEGKATFYRQNFAPQQIDRIIVRRNTWLESALAPLRQPVKSLLRQTFKRHLLP